MKNFFAAMTLAIVLSVSSADAAVPFTDEQVDRIFLFTVNNPAATESNELPVNAVTFQTNFNDFMLNFIGRVGSGEDAAMLERLFMLNEPSVTEHDDGIIFAKNFLNRAAVVGYSAGGNFKVLNFFAAQAENRDDALFNVLILRAFVRSITPDYDAMTLLDDAKKNPSASVIHGDVRYTVTRDGNLNIVTAVAQ